MGEGLFGDLLVIDCASFVAGPGAATILSDFGARVIKIEPPGAGDSYRNLIKMRSDDAIDYFWTLTSRNKESLALDIKSPVGRTVLEALVRKADVFVTNYPLPIRERLRLRPEDITPLNPRLIYASVTPYGEVGPERDRTAYDSTAWWARSGLMEMVREQGSEHALSVPGMGDNPTSMAVYAAIVTALYRREVTGKGGVVRTSLLANGLFANGCQVQAALCDLELTARGPRGKRNAIADTYETADGRTILLALANPAREWPPFAKAVGHEDWLSDPRFATAQGRTENAGALNDLVAALFASETWAHWEKVLGEANLTFGLVATTTDHLNDPQIEANGLFPEIIDGMGLRTVDSPFQIEGEPKRPPRLAPSVGQHTRAILEELGLNADEIEAPSA
jgi:crotonobetainyl-CoA:carnitine CoA-transferase CaiB-like acyl-CoA transferase